MDLQTLLKKGEVKLSGVHPTLREKGLELIKRAYAKGISIIITQGYRSIAEQNALYAQGRTKPGSVVTNAKGGYSYHNFKLAIDFAVLDSDGSVNWNVDRRWREVGAIGQSLGLEWGGAWTSFKDYPHFQLTFGLSMAQLRAGAKPPTPTAPVKTEPVVKPTPTVTIEESEDDVPMKLEAWQKTLIISEVTAWSKVKGYDGEPVINSPQTWVDKVNKGTLTAGELSTLSFAILSRAVKK